MKKLLLIVLPLILSSNDITLMWLESKPRSIAKDFYIWRFLDQDITSDEAIKALGGAKYVNDRIFSRYAKKIGHDETYAVYQCMKAKPKSLISQSADCIEVGLSTYKATKLEQYELENVIEKLEGRYPKKESVLNILKGTIPFTKLISSKAETFFDTFNQCGSKYRQDYFNHTLPKSTLKRLGRHKEFTQTIKLIVTNAKLDNLQKSLFDVNDTGLDHHGSFFLAINAIRHNKKKEAMRYLDSAFEKAYYQFDKDKVIFWKYQLTFELEYLKQLQQSWDINIYSIYACNEVGKEQQNIIFTLPKDNNSNNIYDSQDPFEWLKVLKDTKKMDEEKLHKYEKIFASNENIGHLDFVKERFYNYKKSFYPLPYRNILKDLDINRQALIYAIARQESRFIPTSISTAYAMGLMQIMPFLSKAIAKELQEIYNIDDQFDPDINLKYANHHLNFLQKRLVHPLFIAYGYNGGIGFATRTIKNNSLFSTGHMYEPFLSMELIPYDETRKYGKKVLANYYIYQNYLNTEEKISFATLLQTAVSHFYRKGE